MILVMQCPRSYVVILFFGIVMFCYCGWCRCVYGHVGWSFSVVANWCDICQIGLHGTIRAEAVLVGSFVLVYIVFAYLFIARNTIMGKVNLKSVARVRCDSGGIIGIEILTKDSLLLIAEPCSVSQKNCLTISTSW